MATRQQNVQMPGLRRAQSRRRLIRQAVSVQHDHLFKIVGNRAGCGQTSHSGADHYRLPADLSNCHRALLIDAALPTAGNEADVGPFLLTPFVVIQTILVAVDLRRVNPVDPSHTRAAESQGIDKPA
jgi:hypothetical protein